MTSRRTTLALSAVLVAALGAAGCSGDSGKDGDKDRSRSGAEKAGGSKVVSYHADYPEYGSLDAIAGEADLVVTGQVVASRSELLKPAAPAGKDPAANPRAGAPAAAPGETDPLVVTVSTVKVAKSIAGGVKAGDTIEVSQLGGTYKGVTYKEESTKHLAKGGGQYALMLASHGKGAPYDLLNPGQAMYTVGKGSAVQPVTGEGFADVGTVDKLAKTVTRAKQK
ncbi:hypothetical protein [Streptomyces sp. NPDC014894]|uniref:hypothetical protein n=1 Tax=Streptomyces sp. NPDC014894 TaxID=3364931 RepID=UPI003702B4CE